MLRATYDWMMRLAASPRADRALATVAFLESSVFPIPPDAMIVPMVLARPERVWRIVVIATVASVSGGLLGYAIGYFLYEAVGRWIIELYGLSEKAEQYRLAYAEWGLWIILIKGLTPIPYKLVTIASGLAAFDIWVFTLASIVTRGGRFLLVAALMRAFGSPIRRFVEERLTLVTTAFAAAIILGFVVLRYL
ncbi:MAG: DedA family protein [Geminicoccaceae bacterium]|nr:DedA family protein [Geminicoccaceae bacterium]MCX7629123.1 DedA family protein [Geminicoccaceae bacterium]MDW8124865.1 YqaA family protein [Geminicoccaceae bacterium]MDW8340817.1 YqaA family protein [Geminicoccaceae bacterium]